MLLSQCRVSRVLTMLVKMYENILKTQFCVVQPEIYQWVTKWVVQLMTVFTSKNADECAVRKWDEIMLQC